MYGLTASHCILGTGAGWSQCYCKQNRLQTFLCHRRTFSKDRIAGV